MTTIRARLRTVATASLLALAIISLPATSAYAAPNTPQGRCADRGGVWDPNRGCATKGCESDSGYHSHGEKITLISGSFPGYVKLRKTTTYKCDGFTGNWVQV